MSTKTSRITAVLSLNQREFTSGFQKASSTARAFGKVLAGVVTSAGVKSLFSAAAGRESLLRGLAATSDGLKTASEQFERLQEVATRNAQSVDAVALAFTQLRGAAVSANDAEKTIDAVANALNRVGKGADFSAVMTNLVQIASRTSGLGDEIKETANYLPEIRKLAQLRFGTDTGEGLNQRGITGKMFIAGITEELAKYERASGGAAAATAKFSASFENLKVAAGNWILPGVTSSINAVADGMDLFSRDLSRWLLEAKQGLKELKRDAAGTDLGWIAGKALDILGPDTAAEDLARKRREEEETARELEKRRLAEVERALQKEIDLGNANLQLARAEALNDEEGVRRAKEEIAVLRDKQDIMKSLNATEEEALKIIRERVRLETAAANAQKNFERAKQRLRETDDLDLLEARAQGDSRRRLSRMERKRRLNDETERLREMGYDPAAARALAERRIRAEDMIQENEEREARGLRPRIRSFRGEDALRRRWRRMSDDEKDRLASLGSLENPERGDEETGYEVFRRKQAGGLDAYRFDAGMRERSAPRQREETGRASEGQVAKDEALLREIQGLRRDVQATVTAAERMKPRR